MKITDPRGSSQTFRTSRYTTFCFHEHIQLLWVVMLILFGNGTIVSAQFFDNIAPDLGIQHSVETPLQFGGHGVCFFDFDNDGWDDITFIQENDSIILYRNTGGSFEKIPSVAFQPGQIRQALWVDYDNDGDYDLFVTSTIGYARLYNNDGSFNFTDVTLQAGIQSGIANNFGVSFADYDNDGYLDFYIARNQMIGDESNPLHQNSLYRNNGDGTFTETTQIAGVGNGLQPSFFGVWMDINKDFLPDLYVLNDRGLWGNSMYLNNGDGTFTDIALESGTQMFGEDPMGAMFADFDNDGDIDFVLSNGGVPTKPMRMYTNNGDLTFNEQAGEFGINVPVTFHCTWGGTWIDIDNDSYLDFYITTGLIPPATPETRSYLFKSIDANQFIDSPALFSSDHVAASYSAAKGDIDNDGIADLVVQSAFGTPSFIWKNNYGAQYGNNYIKITLEGTVSNTMAIGSWITVHCGNQAYTHYTRCGENFVSQDSQHHIFGLRQHEVIDSLIVEFPSGHVDKFYNISVNQHFYISEGDSYQTTVSFPTNAYLCNGTSIILDAGSHSNYLWNTGSTEQTITVNESGSYWVEVSNEFGISTVSEPINLVFNDNPEIEEIITDPDCYAAQNGSIDLNNINQTPAENITWDHGDEGHFIDALAAGSYTYTYTDVNGCATTGTIELTEPQEIAVIIIDFPVTEEADGGYDLFIFGGTPPYTVFINDEPAETSSNSLSEGEYIATIIDAKGCTFSGSFTINTLVKVHEALQQRPNLYPNPVHLKDMLTLEFSAQNRAFQMLVFDDAGRLCYEANLQGNTPTIQLITTDFAQAAGAYTLIFIKEDQSFSQQRIIVVP